MPWKVFEQLNAEREAAEEPLFANPRNAASGTLKVKILGWWQADISIHIFIICWAKNCLQTDITRT